MMQKTLKIALLAALLPALGACESLGLKGWGSDRTNSLADACPPALVPAEVATVTMSAGDNPFDLKATASMKVTSQDCHVKAGDDGVTKEISLQLTATKGPAMKDSALDLPFFVAITDASGNVLNKKMYRTSFTFDNGVSSSEDLTVLFKMNKAQAGTSNIYVGFYKLSADAGAN